MDSHLSEEINHAVQQSVGNESIVFSDKSSSYVDFVELHITEKIRQADNKRDFGMGTHYYRQCKKKLIGKLSQNQAKISSVVSQ